MKKCATVYLYGNMRKVIFIFVSFFLFFLLPVFQVSAQANSQSDKTVFVSSDQVIEGDYVVKGEIVDISGTINGDLYVAGGMVTVDGVVNGDLLVAGGNISIKGNIINNARVVGGNVIIAGNIGKNLSVFSGSVNLLDTASVGGSIVGAGGNLVISSPVTKDIRVAGGQVTLGNKIGGNVFAYARRLSTSMDTNIIGNMTYWSDQEADIAPSSIIQGEITQNMLPENSFEKKQETGSLASSMVGFIAFGKIISFLSAFIVGVLFIGFFPNYSKRVISTVANKFWKNVGIGVLTAIIIPIVILLLFLSFIGIPLAVLGGMIFAFLLYAARILASILIGNWIIRRFTKKAHLIWALLVGLFVYEIINIIPVFGWIFAAIIISAGLGAILREKRHSYLQLRAKKMI